MEGFQEGKLTRLIHYEGDIGHNSHQNLKLFNRMKEILKSDPTLIKLHPFSKKAIIDSFLVLNLNPALVIVYRGEPSSKGRVEELFGYPLFIGGSYEKLGMCGDWLQKNFSDFLYL